MTDLQIFKHFFLIGLINGVYRHFQHNFSYIVAVSFIGGGNHRPFASH